MSKEIQTVNTEEDNGSPLFQELSTSSTTSEFSSNEVEVPVSPSLTVDPQTPSPSMSSDPSSSQTTTKEPTEIKRAKNYEDSHLFICNLFFCFMMPFICRCSPITEKNIPNASKDDTCDVVMSKVSPRWKQKYSQYLDDMIQYDSKKQELERSDPEAAFVIYYS